MWNKELESYQQWHHQLNILLLLNVVTFTNAALDLIQHDF